ncbi:tumor necrosis factor receptor type 1-associated DEATH domain protein [Triplophysa rosa]|uniref:Tumor necrosis factor receptor type 1-associated DEATH domain protein n=1 Tax=Triplophysa rosa TaxID=992332 RepID=A0A9W8CBC3_TRIRA|nr:tumor necrosis factor receptor type 1-associated DEATH domain protein [Triplophysa rosa]KAI7813910.1 tumor necrosis factor receptor type 1-associated DEATH domain protein [Triplophysa rosa]
MDSIDTKRLNETNMSDRAWSGCAVLFLGCSSPAHNLLSVYKDEQGKFILFKVIKLTLIDSAGGMDGYEILKLHDADPFLGVELKFMTMPCCQRFLESYASGSLLQFLSQHASRLLTLPDGVAMETQLKAGVHTLDHSLQDLGICLDHVQQSQPVRLRDDEVTQLEQQLQNSYGPPSQPQQEVPKNCFLFQKRVFDDRPLTSADQQRFAAHVGRDWKRVGRALQKNCRALKGPAIDNLSYEYEREGLYEQAYQLLGRFIQSEGRSAKLGRLISALEETKMITMAEVMLGIQPRD